MSNDKPTPPAARLVGFHVPPEHRLPAPLQHVGLVNVDQPPGNLAGWGIEVRNAMMFLGSPPGWAQGKGAAQWSKTGDRTFYGPIPLANVTLIWQGASAEMVDKLQRYSLPEMRTARAAVEAGPALDPKEIGDP